MKYRGGLQRINLHCLERTDQTTFYDIKKNHRGIRRCKRERKRENTLRIVQSNYEVTRHSQCIQTAHCFLINVCHFTKYPQIPNQLLSFSLHQLALTPKYLGINDLMIYFLFCSYVKIIWLSVPLQGFCSRLYLMVAYKESGLKTVADPRRRRNTFP